jgi:hypothetical protein
MLLDITSTEYTRIFDQRKEMILMIYCKIQE